PAVMPAHREQALAIRACPSAATGRTARRSSAGAWPIHQRFVTLMLSTRQEVVCPPGPEPTYLKPIRTVPVKPDRSTSPDGMNACSVSDDSARLPPSGCQVAAVTLVPSKLVEIHTLRPSWT